MSDDDIEDLNVNGIENDNFMDACADTTLKVCFRKSEMTVSKFSSSDQNLDKSTQLLLRRQSTH